MSNNPNDAKPISVNKITNGVIAPKAMNVSCFNSWFALKNAHVSSGIIKKPIIIP